MMFKTHLAIGMAVAIYFLPWVTNKLLFIPVVLIASVLPDIDSGFSNLGRRKMSRPLQWFVEHRGVIHSYTTCVVLTLVFMFFYPIIALPFFLGYSFHLFADSFTIQGIKPFWPFKWKSKGYLNTGGKIEDVVFFTFVIIDLVLVVLLFLGGGKIFIPGAT
jgi:membrane-bound metal-dependent hydrolase YbcI (DUF457 family)